MLRAFQNDHNSQANPTMPVLRGNHNGGVVRFGPDGKLYIIIGDNGRRGFTQNNLEGPVPDDDFGGPEPDNAHLTGVILRLNDDGSTPSDNPFHQSGEQLGRRIGGDVGAEVAANLQRVFAYGVRNSFGMTFDPKKGDLWTTENGGRSFDEINHVERGFNGGWVQVMGPLDRVQEFKEIEISAGIGANGPNGLQQLRFPATSISDSPKRRRSGCSTSPDLTFATRSSAGSKWCRRRRSASSTVPGSARSTTAISSSVRQSVAPANAGHLYRFRLNGGRNHFQFDDARLKDKVADNNSLTTSRRKERKSYSAAISASSPTFRQGRMGRCISWGRRASFEKSSGRSHVERPIGRHWPCFRYSSRWGSQLTFASARTAHAVPAAEIHWSAPCGKPLSKYAWMGTARDLTYHDPSSSCVRSRNATPRRTAGSSAAAMRLSSSAVSASPVA